uniref:protein kinase 3 n=1 Tax=Fragaria vesca subsp. vesca TaxID=101020 RepID=UPI0005C94E21|nr:PREDICTED: protein kinase 3 [Fragaria vesca subsp. vesca]
MDSGNSGSMQSSSGGDDESYDSRAESISALLGPTMTNHHHHQHPPQVAQHHQQQQTQHHRHHPHHHVEFDTLSNIFDSRLTNPNPLLNLDMVWSKTMRSDQSMADLGGQNDLSQPFLTNSQLGGQVSRGGGGGAGGGSSTFTQIPSSSAPNDQSLNNNNVGGVRNTNPKKRSRASRRAPTTVLTTDTTNFRAMVQEFTGIPAPPFTSSPFPRSRLDLFGSSASSMVRSGPGQNHTDPSSLPPYLLRPFPHKAPLLPSPSSPSLLPSSDSNANSNIGGSNLQQSQSLLNMNNMQNSSSSSVLNFQSLFQNQQQPQSNLQKYPLPGSGNILGSSKSSQGSLGVLEDQFGLSHGLNVQQLPNIVSSSSSDGGLTLQQQQPRHDNNPRTTTTTTMNWVDNNNKSDGNVDLLRSVNGNYGNGKLNYAASSSSNVVDKAGVQLENNVSATTARSEGMVESWICSSD